MGEPSRVLGCDCCRPLARILGPHCRVDVRPHLCSPRGHCHDLRRLQDGNPGRDRPDAVPRGHGHNRGGHFRRAVQREPDGRMPNRCGRSHQSGTSLACRCWCRCRLCTGLQRRCGRHMCCQEAQALLSELNQEECSAMSRLMSELMKTLMSELMSKLMSEFHKIKSQLRK